MGRRNRKTAARQQPVGSDVGGNKGQRLVELALEKLGQGRDKEAVNLLKRAVKGMPGDATAQLLLGLACHRQGRPQLGLPHLHQAVSLAPEDPEGYFHLANALKACGEQDAAANAYSRALALKPDFSK